MGNISAKIPEKLDVNTITANTFSFPKESETGSSKLVKIDTSEAKFNIPINCDNNITANKMDGVILSGDSLTVQERINCNGMVASELMNTDYLTLNKGRITTPALEEIPTQEIENTLYFFKGKNDVPTFKYINNN